MRKSLVFLMVAVISVAMFGCSGDSLTLSSKERSHRMKRTMQKDMKLFWEDFDRALLLDRSSRLTPNNM